MPSTSLSDFERMCLAMVESGARLYMEGRASEFDVALESLPENLRVILRESALDLYRARAGLLH